MKSFRDSSLEVQMVFMVFFLMIALIYFLLLIYEIIWKQKWKKIIINMAVFTAAFLMALCFYVRHLILCEESTCFFFEVPYVVFGAAGICGIAYAVMQIAGYFRQGKNHLQGSAIQESLDNLPSGAGFFDEQGIPVLINRQMYRICRCLTGRDIQSAAELQAALEHPLEDRVSYDPDFQVYCLSDGSVWKFSQDYIVTQNGERFLQFLASEVSELYQSKQLLEKENRKLQEMSAALKELSKNIVTLTREEEILAMKMRVHDNLGYSVLASHRMLLQDSEDSREVFLSQWNSTLNLLRRDNESEAGKTHLRVQERAEALGVKLLYTGEMPDDQTIAELLDMILLEAISNSVRHAGATELYLNMKKAAHEWMFVITNNGRKPEKEIVQGGGLSAIRKKVENCGGSIRIGSFPEYSLTIKIPKKEESV